MNSLTFVSVNCPLTDAEIKDILARRKPNDFIREKWFVGAHVVNLHRIRHVRVD